MEARHLRPRTMEPCLFRMGALEWVYTRKREVGGAKGSLIPEKIENLVSWIKHPYKENSRSLTGKAISLYPIFSLIAAL